MVELTVPSEQLLTPEKESRPQSWQDRMYALTRSAERLIENSATVRLFERLKLPDVLQNLTNPLRRKESIGVKTDGLVEKELHKLLFEPLISKEGLVLCDPLVSFIDLLDSRQSSSSEFQNTLHTYLTKQARLPQNILELLCNRVGCKYDSSTPQEADAFKAEFALKLSEASFQAKQSITQMLLEIFTQTKYLDPEISQEYKYKLEQVKFSSKARFYDRATEQIHSLILSQKVGGFLPVRERTQLQQIVEGALTPQLQGFPSIKKLWHDILTNSSAMADPNTGEILVKPDDPLAFIQDNKNREKVRKIFAQFATWADSNTNEWINFASETLSGFDDVAGIHGNSDEYEVTLPNTTEREGTVLPMEGFDSFAEFQRSSQFKVGELHFSAFGQAILKSTSPQEVPNHLALDRKEIDKHKTIDVPFMGLVRNPGTQPEITVSDRLITFCHQLGKQTITFDIPDSVLELSGLYSRLMEVVFAENQAETTSDQHFSWDTTTQTFVSSNVKYDGLSSSLYIQEFAPPRSETLAGDGSSVLVNKERERSRQLGHQLKHRGAAIYKANVYNLVPTQTQEKRSGLGLSIQLQANHALLQGKETAIFMEQINTQMEAELMSWVQTDNRRGEIDVAAVADTLAGERLFYKLAIVKMKAYKEWAVSATNSSSAFEAHLEQRIPQLMREVFTEREYTDLLISRPFSAEKTKNQSIIRAAKSAPISQLTLFDFVLHSNERLGEADTRLKKWLLYINNVDDKKYYSARTELDFFLLANQQIDSLKTLEMLKYIRTGNVLAYRRTARKGAATTVRMGKYAAQLDRINKELIQTLSTPSSENLPQSIDAILKGLEAKLNYLKVEEQEFTDEIEGRNLGTKRPDQGYITSKRFDNTPQALPQIPDVLRPITLEETSVTRSEGQTEAEYILHVPYTFEKFWEVLPQSYNSMGAAMLESVFRPALVSTLEQYLDRLDVSKQQVDKLHVPEGYHLTNAALAKEIERDLDKMYQRLQLPSNSLQSVRKISDEITQKKTKIELERQKIVAKVQKVLEQSKNEIGCLVDVNEMGKSLRLALVELPGDSDSIDPTRYENTPVGIGEFKQKLERFEKRIKASINIARRDLQPSAGVVTALQKLTRGIFAYSSERYDIRPSDLFPNSSVIKVKRENKLGVAVQKLAKILADANSYRVVDQLIQRTVGINQHQIEDQQVLSSRIMISNASAGEKNSGTGYPAHTHQFLSVMVSANGFVLKAPILDGAHQLVLRREIEKKLETFHRQIEVFHTKMFKSSEEQLSDTEESANIMSQAISSLFLHPEYAESTESKEISTGGLKTERRTIVSSTFRREYYREAVEKRLDAIQFLHELANNPPDQQKFQASGLMPIIEHVFTDPLTMRYLSLSPNLLQMLKDVFRTYKDYIDIPIASVVDLNEITTLNEIVKAPDDMLTTGQLARIAESATVLKNVIYEVTKEAAFLNESLTSNFKFEFVSEIPRVFAKLQSKLEFTHNKDPKDSTLALIRQLNTISTYATSSLLVANAFSQY